MKEISEDPTCVPMIILIAVLSLAVCLLQFYFGNRIGHRYGDPISSAQSLGQKNTVLAVWLALTYLQPIATVGPACYIAWHNIVNSYQIYRRAHEGKL
jgi:BASS family bile acid:Na+ symporter